MYAGYKDVLFKCFWTKFIVRRTVNPKRTPRTSEKKIAGHSGRRTSQNRSSRVEGISPGPRKMERLS